MTPVAKKEYCRRLTELLDDAIRDGLEDAVVMYKDLGGVGAELLDHLEIMRSPELAETPEKIQSLCLGIGQMLGYYWAIHRLETYLAVAVAKGDKCN